MIWPRLSQLYLSSSAWTHSFTPFLIAITTNYSVLKIIWFALFYTLRCTKLFDRPVTVMLQRGPTTTNSSSLRECLDLCLTFITHRSRLHIPQSRRTSTRVLVVFLLLLAGVESNPEPITASLRLGVSNVQSANHKASLLHDVIADHRIDLLVATETWMKANEPAAVTQDIGPTGFQELHRFRKTTSPVAGVALVNADSKICTKCRGKADCRRLSNAAVTAKRETRWKRSGLDADRVEYRSACRAANAEINASRSSFHKERLSAAAGDQQALWYISKDLLHNDDHPPDVCSLEAKLLSDGFSVFFADELNLIAGTICT